MNRPKPVRKGGLTNKLLDLLPACKPKSPQCYSSNVSPYLIYRPVRHLTILHIFNSLILITFYRQDRVTKYTCIFSATHSLHRIDWSMRVALHHERGAMGRAKTPIIRSRSSLISAQNGIAPRGRRATTIPLPEYIRKNSYIASA